jgi:lysophospholipase L1-like esterase
MKHELLALAATLAASLAWGAASQAVHEIPANDSHIARMGRMTEEADGALRFAYPGVRLSFSFTGSTLSFDAWSSGTRSYLEAVVDGGAPQRIKVGVERATFTLLHAGKPGRHRVEIMHRSESWHGVVTLAGFATDGKFDAPPALPQRRLLVLGDSVTCAEGVDRHEGKKDSTWTDPRHSYGMLAAEALRAQVHLVCYGGRGLVRSWNNRTDEHNLPDFYEMAIADAAQPARWDHRRYDPDLIVSAIGTNDFSPGVPERESYVTAYVNFVRTLLRNHPCAQVVLTEGSILNGENKEVMKSYIAETIRRVGDPRMHAVAASHYPGDALDAHPTGEQHARMAGELVPQLRQVMGW